MLFGSVYGHQECVSNIDGQVKADSRLRNGDYADGFQLRGRNRASGFEEGDRFLLDVFVAGSSERLRIWVPTPCRRLRTETLVKSGSNHFGSSLPPASISLYSSYGPQIFTLASRGSSLDPKPKHPRGAEMYFWCR